MKLLCMFLFECLVVLGCGLPKEKEAEHRSLANQERPLKILSDERDSQRDAGKNKLTINFGGMNFNALIDNSGQVTILDYPSEWHGKVSLVRFDDQSVEHPFSPAHCQSIREDATNGSFATPVRGAYRSRVSFEVAPFLSYEFKAAILQAAQAAGYRFSAIFLKNPVEDLKAEVKITLSENSISALIGQMQSLEEQVNLSRKGMIIGPLEKHLIIVSGDILCDLVNDDARIDLVYAIKGEEKTIKVIYNHMDAGR